MQKNAVFFDKPGQAHNFTLYAALPKHQAALRHFLTTAGISFNETPETRGIFDGISFGFEANQEQIRIIDAAASTTKIF